MKKWSFPVGALVELAPQLGRVDGVALRPRRREPLVPVVSWDLAARRIDHGRPGKREVTLIQAEHVAVVGQLLGRPVDYLILRRNLLVSGVNLLSLLGRRFTVGGAVLEATGVCDPCERMEEVLGEGRPRGDDRPRRDLRPGHRARRDRPERHPAPRLALSNAPRRHRGVELCRRVVLPRGRA
jgi:MOSC domain-containing protein YiiM